MDRTPPPTAAVPGGSECDDPDFCTPFSTIGEAVRTRNRMLNVLVPLETAKFGAEVGALWLRYLSRRPGDSLAPTVFDTPSSSIVQGFAGSVTTAERQDELIKEVKGALPGFCLFVPIGTWTTIPIESLLPATSLDYPIDYDQPFEIPGNIAGGVGGSDAGPDWRHVSGTISLTRTADRSGAVVGARIRTSLRFMVFDAVDFCPGQCGAPAEQLLTVPLSRLEASGFAYDVPFLVRYDGPQVEAEIDVTLVPPCSRGPEPAQGLSAATSVGPTAEPA
jgi:hypothetical protein